MRFSMSVHIGVCVRERIRQGTLTHSVVRQRGQRGLIDYNLVRFFFFFKYEQKSSRRQKIHIYFNRLDRRVCALRHMHVKVSSHPHIASPFSGSEQPLSPTLLLAHK